MALQNQNRIIISLQIAAENTVLNNSRTCMTIYLSLYYIYLAVSNYADTTVINTGLGLSLI